MKHALLQPYVSNKDLCINPYCWVQQTCACTVDLNCIRSVCGSVAASEASITLFFSTVRAQRNVQIKCKHAADRKHFKQRSFRKTIYIQVRVMAISVPPPPCTKIRLTAVTVSVCDTQRFTEGGGSLSFFFFLSQFSATATSKTMFLNRSCANVASQCTWVVHWNVLVH